ncbi:hypothetical protein C3473_06820 [Mycobacterium kansasii]|uniref:ESAT-6-like protein EsxR n=1 Tax=Mycobacterium pseudokansasii TaxID=2341080 RepID=A0A498QJQ1_9MYCO|nr:hypothetical protein B1T46_20140 [Mycobacterium kansasii]VAZ90506.1 ESAT-6-like protein EsxR [Mycobacterium pseudokansasii]POX96101.1 hypothetical protein C3473_06820 [Mycobacterium kansasii]VAZ72619.1 ESAT-6-like protein EsxR [Mycobacterium kansasii]VAZ91370.1 ESAT-6-like protein EsxR [Mycobacterium pseudokansasii]
MGAYQSMAGTHQSNTTAMMARDQAEATKWGGWLSWCRIGRCRRRFQAQKPLAAVAVNPPRGFAAAVIVKTSGPQRLR